jgi:AcrR family transcriptional regulator
MRSEQLVSLTGDAGETFTSGARRAQLVAAAIDTIAEVGYAQASLGRIAERVGVSKGVISYHFAGKSELVREVVADVAVKGEAFIRGQAMAEATWPGRLRAWIESNLEFMASHRKEMVAFFEIAVGSRGDKAVGAAVAAVLTAGVTAVRELLASGQAAGEFREDFDPQVTAMAIRAAVDAVPPRLARHPDFDVARYGRELAGLFDAATRRVPPAPRPAERGR